MIIYNKNIHKVCPEGIQPCNMKYRHIYWRRYKKHCTQDNDASVPFQVGTCDLTQFSQLPSVAPSYFPESHQWSEISSFLKVILVLGKARNRRAVILGCRGEWVTWVIWCFAKNSALDVIREQAYCCDEAASYLLLIAVAFGIIWIVSMEECSSLMQNWMQICCSTCSVILNATATQYTCSLNSIYHLHWLVQWSHLK